MREYIIDLARKQIRSNRIIFGTDLQYRLGLKKREVAIPRFGYPPRDPSQRD